MAFKSLKTNIFDKEPEQAGINLKEQWLKYGIFDAVKLIKEKNILFNEKHPINFRHEYLGYWYSGQIND